MEQQLLERDYILLALKDQLNLAQGCMKKYVDKKRRELAFEVGDLVFMKLRPYRLKSLAKKSYEKLSPKFLGPTVY